MKTFFYSQHVFPYILYKKVKLLYNVAYIVLKMYKIFVQKINRKKTILFLYKLTQTSLQQKSIDFKYVHSFTKVKQFQLTLVPKSEVISRCGGDEKTMTMQNRKKDNAKKEKDTSLDPNKSYQILLPVIQRCLVDSVLYKDQVG